MDFQNILNILELFIDMRKLFLYILIKSYFLNIGMNENRIQSFLKFVDFLFKKYLSQYLFIVFSS